MSTLKSEKIISFAYHEIHYKLLIGNFQDSQTKSSCLRFSVHADTEMETFKYLFVQLIHFCVSLIKTNAAGP